MTFFDELLDDVSDLLHRGDDVMEIHQRPSHELGGYQSVSPQEVPFEGVENVAYVVLNPDAGQSVTSTQTADAGEIWELTALSVDIPSVAGSATGTHKVRLFQPTGATNREIEVAFGENDADTDILFRSDTWQATTSRGPGELFIDEDSGFKFTYTNDSNMDQDEVGRFNIQWAKRTI